MKTKHLLLALALSVLVCSVLVANLGVATEPSAVVTPENLALKNTDGSINFTTIYGTSLYLNDVLYTGATAAQANSYLAYFFSTTYYLVNGTTGLLEYNSTNFTAVWDYALTGMGVNGGVLHLKQGNYTASVPLCIPHSTVHRTIKVVGDGIRNTYIYGAAGCASNYIIQSNQTSWQDSEVSLDALTIWGTGVEKGAANLTYVKTHTGDIWIRGSFATNSIPFYWGGSGDSGSSSTIQSLTVYPSGGAAVDKGTYLWGEGLSVQMLFIVMTNTNVSSALRIEGTHVHIDKYAFYLGGGKTCTYVLYTNSVTVTIDSMFMAHDTAPAGSPTAIFYASGTTETGTTIGQLSTMAGGTMFKNATIFANDLTREITHVTSNSLYFNFTSYGATASCYNGSAIPHGLVAEPISITMNLKGPTAYNATIILCAPTLLSSNSTHFIIELVAWETVGWTIVPITAAEAQTVYWYAVYNQ